MEKSKKRLHLEILVKRKGNCYHTPFECEECPIRQEVDLNCSKESAYNCAQKELEIMKTMERKIEIWKNLK